MEDQKVVNIALVCKNLFWLNDLGAALKSIQGYQVAISETDELNLMVQIRKADPLPSICIIDVNLGKAKSMSLLRKIKNEFPEMKLIMLMVYFDWGILKLYKNLPDGFLLKNESPEKMQKDIDNIYYRQNIYSEAIYNRARNLTISDKIRPKHMEFLRLCCTTLTYHEIAEKMELSKRTIDGYRDDLFKQFKVENKTGLVLYALKNKLVLIEDINI